MILTINTDFLLIIINRLAYTVDTNCVLCVVGTKLVSITYMIGSLQSVAQIQVCFFYVNYFLIWRFIFPSAISDMPVWNTVSSAAM